MTHNAGPLLAIAFYDGEYSGDLTALVHLCDLDGSVVPEGRPPFSLLEEALQLLEMSADKYSAPRPLSDYFTVFVGRKIGAEIRQLTRLDVVAQNGNVRASIMSADSPRIDTESVPYTVDDDVVTIACKVLESIVRAG
jgi:hypothetical protein